MDTQKFLDNFGAIAESPGGIDRLRQLILKMAVTGRLVPQDPSEPGALEALELVRETKGPKVKAKVSGRLEIPRIPEEWESLFPAPTGWCWARLDDLGEYVNGLAFNQATWSDRGLPIIRIQNLTNPRAEFNFADGDYPEDRLVDNGDILVSWSATLEAFIWNRGPGVLNQHIFKVVPNESVADQAFLFHLLRHSIRRLADSDAAHGLAMKHINRGPFVSLPVALPPLGEQRRIAAKVDELMALCDELEAQQVRLAEGAARSRVSALEALVEADSPEALTLAWKRVAGSWPLFVGDVEGVKLVRKSVLSVGLRSWGPPKTKERNLTDLGDVVAFQNGYAFKSEWYVDSGTRLVRCQNIGHGDLNWSDVKSLPSERYVEFERFALEAGDIVLALDRPLISTGLKVARVATDDLPALLLQRVARLTPDAKRLDPGFLWLWLRSPAFVSEIDPGRSNGVPHISTKELARIPIWLPGLEEQRRICTQLGLVLDLCDRLEGHLQDLAEEREMLSGSAVRAG